MNRIIDIIPGHACNSRCKYCYIGMLGEKYDNGKMSDDVVDATCTYVKNVKASIPSDDTITLTFFGGEPLLHTDIIQQFSSNLHGTDVLFDVVTNGMLVNELKPWLLSMKERGNFRVSVSYDYCLQDEMRHEGTYQLVRDSIVWLYSNDILHNVVATLSLGSLSRLADVFSDFIRLRRHAPDLQLLFNIDRHYCPEEYDEEAFVRSLISIRSYLARTGSFGLVHPNLWSYKRGCSSDGSLICGAHSGVDIDGSIYPVYNIAFHSDVRKNLLRYGSVFDDFAAVMARREQVMQGINWTLPEQCQKCENWCRENLWRSIQTSLSEASGCPGDPHCRIFGLLTQYLLP